jgi:1,4-dihydroxy-2-naphthoate octaprenyltransferase
LVGIAVAIRDSVFLPGPALAALLVAVLLQIGTNFANDYADFKTGVDTEERLGPTRVTQAGLLSERSILIGASLVFLTAALLGVYLAVIRGWIVIVIGLLSILAGISYTSGPFPLGYYGLGDLAVFIFFGLVAVGGTYYVQAGRLTSLVLWASVPIGALATGILVVNNLRDIPTDRKTGKRTLAVRLGTSGTRIFFGTLLLLSYLVPLGIWWTRPISMWVLLPLVSVPLAIRLFRTVSSREGRDLNPALAATGQLELIFSLLFSLGLVLS